VKTGLDIANDLLKVETEGLRKLKRKTYYENVPIKPQRVYYELNKFSDDNTDVYNWMRSTPDMARTVPGGKQAKNVSAFRWSRDIRI